MRSYFKVLWLFFTFFIGISLQRALQNDSISEFHTSQIHTITIKGGYHIGYYYVDLFVGSPPQEESVILDTGSMITAFPCSDCGSNCGNHIDPPFDPSKSLTSSDVKCDEQIGEYTCRDCDGQKCTFSIGYAEGSSLYGYYKRDYVILGDELLAHYQNIDNYLKQNQTFVNYINSYHVKFTFGCTTVETNLFKTQEAAGILGLGVSTNSSNHLPNLIDFTFEQHREQNESLAFSLCYAHEGGFMTVGGYNSDKHLAQAKTFIINYDPNKNGQYNVKIHAAKVGGYELPLTLDDFDMDQGSFFDSGTTLFYAHAKIFNAIKAAVNIHCSQQGNCKGKTSDPECFIKEDDSDLDFFKTFPPLYFQLDDDFVYTWQPDDYLTSDDNKKFCFPFYQISGRVILGGVFMRHYDILFDREKEQIHLTRSNCSEEYEGPTFEDSANFSKSSPHSVPRNVTKPKRKETQKSDDQTKKGGDFGVVLGVMSAIVLILVFALFIIFYIRRRIKQREYLLKENSSSSDQRKVEIATDDSARSSEGKNSANARAGEDNQRMPNKYINNNKMLQQIDEVDSNVMSVNYIESPYKNENNIPDPTSPVGVNFT